MDEYLKNTDVIDSDNESIRIKSRELTQGVETDIEKGMLLFYFVRDQIKFNMYAPTQQRKDHMASRTLRRGNGICLHKAILLVALSRVVGIPARLELADIRNHRIPNKLRALIGGGNDLITNGFAQFYLRDKWLHVSPVYDKSTCRKNGFIPVEFDGVDDARASAYDRKGRPHIEYLKGYGYYADFPWAEICKAREEFASTLGIKNWTEHPL